jgi:predicted transcriptional regulator
MLLSGVKTAELRRTPVRAAEGIIGLIYASSPNRALVGAFRSAGVSNDRPEDAWSRWSPRLGLTREEFDKYVEGCERVTTVLVGDVRAFVEPVPLESLRRRWERFTVPQSFRYPTSDEVAALLNGEGHLVHELSQTTVSRSVNQA